MLRIVHREDAGVLVFGMTTQQAFPRRGWTALYPLLSDVNGQLDFGVWSLDPPTERMVFRAALPVVGAAYEVECLRRVMAYVTRSMTAMEDAMAQGA